MSDPVFQLQADVHARASAHGFFFDMPVLLNEKGLIPDDLENLLKTFTAKNGKSGAALVIDRPLREVNRPDISGPEFDVVIPCGAYELPLKNRASGGTGKTVEEICTETMSLMHGWVPRPGIGQIYCDKEAVSPVVGLGRLLVCEILLRSRMRLAAPARVKTPVITGDASAVQIGCNTPAATIYYTVNGSAPWAGNPAAQLFGVTVQTDSGVVIVTQDGDPLIVANPFSVTPGTLVRAAAFAENKQGSDGAAATLK